MSKIKSSTLYAVDSCNYYYRTAILVSIIIALTATTTSCGYRLSGINDSEQLFSPLLKKISIEGIPRSDTFRMQLKKDSLAYRIKVVAAEYATTRIVIKNKKIKQHVITIGDDAKTREYLLRATIDFLVIVDGNEHTMQSIQSETTYAYYPQHVSISLNEKKRAVALLDRDLSAKLISRVRVLTNTIYETKSGIASL